MKIKKHLSFNGRAYSILLGQRFSRADKEEIMKVYNECEEVNFQPSKVNKIYKVYRTHHTYIPEHTIRKINNNSYKLIVQGWYIKSGTYPIVNKLLKDYLSSEDKEQWLDEHATVRGNRRYNPPTGEENIYLISYTKKYRVTRYNQQLHKGVYYGEFDTIEEAIKVRDEMKKKGWPIPPRKRRKYHHDPEKKYIHKNKQGKYIIVYNREHFGTWNTLEDAIEERDWLMENDWDYNNIDAY